MPQRKKTVKIPAWAEQILRGSEFDDDGKLLRLPQQLERSSYTEIDKILKALGGKWNRSRKAHVFPSDARVLLGAAFESGEALDKKKTFEQFDTPPELARRMVELAEIRNYDDVLEPSAGVGNLLEALFDGNPPGYVQAIELDLDRANGLREKFSDIGIWQGDFLEWPGAMVEPPPIFDAVLINPPFSNNQDIRHVRHAWELLRPGGRLVAIISPHSIFAEDQLCFEFRQWLREIGATVDVLEEGTFAESGTSIRAQLIVAIKGEMEAVARNDRDWPPNKSAAPDPPQTTKARKAAAKAAQPSLFDFMQ